MNFLEMNISAGFIISANVIVRKFGINKLPNEIFSVLWLIAGIRLIIPFSLTSVFSIYSIFHNYEYNINTRELLNPIYINNTIEYQSFGSNILSKAMSLEKYRIFIWVIGVILVSIYFMIAFYKSYNEVTKAKPINRTSYINEIILDQKLLRSVSIKVSSNISTPVSIGIIRPVILFPKNYNFNNKLQLQHILIHECTHIKYFHFILKLVSIIVVSIYWINPFIWLLYFYVEQDMELFCDRRTIKILGESQRESYAISLVDMAEFQNGNNLIYNCFIRSSITERIVSIMKFKKTSLCACVITFVIPICSATAFATTSNVVNINEEMSNIVVLEHLEPIQGNISNEIFMNVNLEEIKDYVEEDNTRAAFYLQINGYKYTSYGSMPSKITISMQKDGYTYKGTLGLEEYVYDTANDKYIGYYSGKIYR